MLWWLPSPKDKYPSVWGIWHRCGGAAISIVPLFCSQGFPLCQGKRYTHTHCGQASRECGATHSLLSQFTISAATTKKMRLFVWDMTPRPVPRPPPGDATTRNIATNRHARQPASKYQRIGVWVPVSAVGPPTKEKKENILLTLSRSSFPCDVGSARALCRAKVLPRLVPVPPVLSLSVTGDG